MKGIGTRRIRALDLPSPDIEVQRPIYLQSVSEALVKFVNENYPGIVDITVATNDNRLVVICPDSLAYVVMTLIHIVHGKRKIHLTLDSETDRFLIKIKPNDLFSDDPCHEFDFVRVVKRSGFDIYETSEELVIFAKLTRQAVYHVYAVTMDEMYAALIRTAKKFDDYFNKDT